MVVFGCLARLAVDSPVAVFGDSYRRSYGCFWLLLQPVLWLSLAVCIGIPMGVFSLFYSRFYGSLQLFVSTFQWVALASSMEGCIAVFSSSYQHLYGYRSSWGHPWECRCGSLGTGMDGSMDSWAGWLGTAIKGVFNGRPCDTFAWAAARRESQQPLLEARRQQQPLRNYQHAGHAGIQSCASLELLLW